MVAALAGFAYQSLATRWDLSRTPAPGRILDIGDHRLHIWCSGSGTPSVILETGLGGTAADWGLVQPEVAKFTSVCSYDRAGMGYSDPGPTPRTLARINGELTQLLDRAGVIGPVVLAGASIGGLSARLLASEHPDRVAGLVLIDPSSEDEAPHLPPIAPYVALYSSLGIFRLRGVTFGPPPASLPSATRRFAEATSRRTSAYTTTLDEMTHLPEGLAEAKATRRPLAIPLVVVTAGQGSDTAWFESQRGQALLSSRGSQLVAVNSGHCIAVGQLDLVIRAIQSVVDAARRQSDASVCAERPEGPEPALPRR